MFQRVSNLIGKVFSCQEKRYRIVAGLTRIYLLLSTYSGKVAIGRARYLLNIVFIHLDVRFISFPY
jgi:hypothetical protein